jgi:HSP20 family protein
METYDMTVALRHSPLTIRHAVDRLFYETAFRPIARGYSAPRRLPLDITSNDDVVTVEAALPGVRPENVEITVREDTLTISVKETDHSEQAEAERVYREVRRSHGSRTLRLPKGLDFDAATATFDNGMLRIAIPRAEQAKPRQITISTVTEASAATADSTADDSPSTEAPAEDADKA